MSKKSRRRQRLRDSRLIRGDVGATLRVTRLRRRATITVAVPTVLVQGVPTVPSLTSANFDAAALRRLEKRCARVADMLEREARE